MLIRIIDTHCHLDMEEFDKDREDVIERSKAHGVEAIIIPATRDDEFERDRKLCDKHKGFLYYMVGVHPHEAKTCTQQSYEMMEEHLKNPLCVGIGEIGLDYHYDFSPRDTQREVFANMLDLASQIGKPVSIHSRESTEDMVDMLKSHKDIKGVIHCFSGEEKLLKTGLELGLFFGIGGVVTFKNSLLRKNINELPLERIVLETDAPYLAPVPKRGKRNEPMYIHYVIDTLSELKMEKKDKIAEIAYNNSRQIFLNAINESR